MHITKTAGLLLLLSACTTKQYATEEWEGINYASIACARNAANATCQPNKDDDINAIGKGKR